MNRWKSLGSRKAIQCLSDLLTCTNSHTNTSNPRIRGGWCCTAVILDILVRMASHASRWSVGPPPLVPCSSLQAGCTSSTSPSSSRGALSRSPAGIRGTRVGVGVPYYCAHRWASSVAGQCRALRTRLPSTLCGFCRSSELLTTHPGPVSIPSGSCLRREF